MHVELVSELNARDEFAALAVEWISRVKDLAFPGFDENLSAGLLPFTPPDPPAGYWMLGRPTALKANAYIQRRPHDSLGRSATYSRRSWGKLVNGLAEAYPFRVSLVMSAVDDTGKNAGSGSSLLIGVRRDPDSPGWTRFEASLPPDIVDLSRAPSSGNWSHSCGNGLRRLRRATATLLMTRILSRPPLSALPRGTPGRPCPVAGRPCAGIRG